MTSLHTSFKLKNQENPQALQVDMFAISCLSVRCKNSPTGPQLEHAADV